MDLEKIINEQLELKLSDGSLEKLVSLKLEDVIKSIVSSAFSWGDAKNALEKKLTDTMVTAIEKHDFNDYLIKLDYILTDIINHSNLTDNAEILKNFRNLMLEPDTNKISIEDIFKKYCEYVAENVETDGMKIDYEGDGEPTYQPVQCTVQITEKEHRFSSSFDYLDVVFSCDLEDEGEAEKFDFSINLCRWNKKNEQWEISCFGDATIGSLRYIDDFTILIMRLARARTGVIITDYEISEEIVPKKRPELTYE